LEERGVGDPEAKAGKLFLEELFSKDPGGTRGSIATSLDDRVEVDGRPREARRSRHKPGLHLARAATISNGQVSQDALAAAPVIRRDSLTPRPIANLVASRVAALGGE